MKAPRFMTEYANYQKKAIKALNASEADKAQAYDRIDRDILDYQKGFLTATSAMDNIGCAYHAVYMKGGMSHD